MCIGKIIRRTPIYVGLWGDSVETHIFIQFLIARALLVKVIMNLMMMVSKKSTELIRSRAPPLYLT